MSKIQVCIADDHNLVRDGIKKLLESSGKYEVTLDARNGLELLNGLADLKTAPQLALIDVSMPVMEGSETVREIQKLFPALACVALSHNDDFQNVFRMIDSGAKAYLLKDCEPEYLFETLEKVLKNGSFYDSFVMGKIMEHNKAQAPKIEVTKALLGMLNAKEIEFIKYCCSELTYKEIADRMNVSPKTVEGYRVTVFNKLQVGSRVGLVLFAIENSLYRPGIA
jgi:DNA-binding NarL/FixJ family response regulator